MSMGSSLFLIVANLVMQELEKTCIKKLPFNLVIYKRYDDIVDW